MFDVSREMGSSVALYSRKVLIQTKAADILPKWLRFLRGECGLVSAALRAGRIIILSNIKLSKGSFTPATLQRLSFGMCRLSYCSVSHT